MNLFQCILVKMVAIIYGILVVCLVFAAYVNTDGFDPKDVDLALKPLIQKYGYPFEEYELVTPDGYILTTHRIPHGKFQSKPNKKPILLTHGMGGSSENFIALGPGRAISFVLAEQGYDVWLMNARGNFFSRKHKFLDPDKTKFWDFSLDEISLIDTPVNIDHILNVTNQKQVALLGHSQGSTICFGISCGLPEYNKKISLHVHLAPSVFHNFIEEKFTVTLSKYTNILENLASMLNLVELCPPNIYELSRHLISRNDTAQVFYEIFRHVSGTKSNYIKMKSIPFFFRSVPGGISIRQILQYLQVVRTGEFKKYDFGEKENLRRYKSKFPPIYDLRRSTAPVLLVHLKKDWLSPMAQTEYLRKFFPHAHVYLVDDEEFSHFDFICAYNAKYKVYNRVINIMDDILQK